MNSNYGWKKIIPFMSHLSSIKKKLDANVFQFLQESKNNAGISRFLEWQGAFDHGAFFPMKRNNTYDPFTLAFENIKRVQVFSLNQKRLH